MSTLKKHGLGLICFITALMYLVHVFLPVSAVYHAYNLLAGILLGFAIFSVRRVNQITALLLVAIGTAIFFDKGIEPIRMIDAFGKNINLLALFLVVPFIGVIISIGGYLTALKLKVQEQEKKGRPHPYLLSSLLNSSIGIILNIGSIAITYHIAEKSFSNFHTKKMGMVLLRSFGFCMLWSPYFVNVGLVLVIFHVSWIKIGWIGIVLGLIYLLISTLFFRSLHFHDDSIASSVDGSRDTLVAADISKKIYALIAWSSGLIAISFILDYYLTVNMLTIVSLMALIYPLIWSILIRVFREYLQEIWGVIASSFERLKNEIVIFIGAGYFGVALSLTNVGDILSQQILSLSLGSVYLMSILVILLTILVSQIGVHPVIVIIGIGGSLSPEIFHVSPEYLAILLLIAWTLATLVSPFSGSVLMAASMMKEYPWIVSRKNMIFVFVLMLSLPFALYLFMRLGFV